MKHPKYLYNQIENKLYQRVLDTYSRHIIYYIEIRFGQVNLHLPNGLSSFEDLVKSNYTEPDKDTLINLLF